MKEQKEELSYILVTPYTILKSRTGGVFARLLANPEIELVAAQMIAPSQELTNEYAEGLKDTVSKRNSQAAQWFYDYVIRTFSPTEGRRHRVLMLVFKGENVTQKLFAIAGDITTSANTIAEKITGETIRDTYADLVISPSTNRVRYFEPAVLTPPAQKFALPRLKMFADFAANESNIVENVTYENPEKIERTLVIIKPENWIYPSSKPGNIIDMLSRTGLRIIGCKVYQMSQTEALEFYGSVKNVLREKIGPAIAEKAKKKFEEEFNIKLDDACIPALNDSVGKAFADNEFYKIIEFMSGKRPNKEYDKNFKNKTKCMVLVYEGEDAVNKIRRVLGPTDPTKAPGGTIRREFGTNIMINTAHASDSPENAKREMDIVKISTNNLSKIVNEYLDSKGIV
jgi:nucleoside diphosphate kinase